jgi:hypothetical protein
MNVSTGLQTAAGATVPALAFFHICLPEYTELIEAHVPISGVQQEACGSASVDSGLFTAFLEAGDVKVSPSSRILYHRHQRVHIPQD